MIFREGWLFEWHTYLPTYTYYVCVTHLRIKNFDQKHIGQFRMNNAQLIFYSKKNTNKYVRHNLRYKGDLSTMSQYLSMVILPRYGWSQARSHQDLFGVSLPYSLVTLGNLGIFVNFWKSIEHHRQSSNIFRQSGNMDTKITCMPLSKSWELHNKEVKHLHVPR